MSLTKKHFARLAEIVAMIEDDANRSIVTKKVYRFAEQEPNFDDEGFLAAIEAHVAQGPRYDIVVNPGGSQMTQKQIDGLAQIAAEVEDQRHREDVADALADLCDESCRSFDKIGFIDTVEALASARSPRMAR